MAVELISNFEYLYTANYIQQEEKVRVDYSKKEYKDAFGAIDTRTTTALAISDRSAGNLSIEEFLKEVIALYTSHWSSLAEKIHCRYS